MQRPQALGSSPKLWQGDVFNTDHGTPPTPSKPWSARLKKKKIAKTHVDQRIDPLCLLLAEVTSATAPNSHVLRRRGTVPFFGVTGRGRCKCHGIFPTGAYGLPHGGRPLRTPLGIYRLQCVPTAVPHQQMFQWSRVWGLQFLRLHAVLGLVRSIYKCTQRTGCNLTTHSKSRQRYVQMRTLRSRLLTLEKRARGGGWNLAPTCRFVPNHGLLGSRRRPLCNDTRPASATQSSNYISPHIARNVICAVWRTG